MVKRNAIFSAVTNVCKGYDYSITESKSTDSIYVKIHYGKSEICMRFSDHKGKSKNLKWFDYTAPKAKYGDMVRYIENRIKMVKYITFADRYPAVYQNTVFNYCIWNCTYRCFASRSTKL